MIKTIGIVAEGPRDYDLLSAVIDTITKQENNYQQIQPEPNAVGKLGNGWKGVWKWCERNQGNLAAYMNAVTPVIDLLVIHMDGDVCRCEKEVHCGCQRALCDMPGDTHPLNCQKIIADRNNCPIVIPCKAHRDDPDSGATFLKTFINSLLLPSKDLAVSYVIPYDSTDAWIVAAFDQYENYESLLDPWNSIIARTPCYHGIKIKNRPNKSNRTYEELALRVCENWDNIIQKCPQAKQFDEDVKRFLL